MGPALAPPKLTVFVAASHGVRQRAAEIAAELEAQGRYVVKRHALRGEPRTLPNLVEAARDCDVGLIAHDSETWCARGPHGPVFEAGLLLGQASLELPRVVLVTSATSNTLPHYLDGLPRLPLDEPLDGLMRALDELSALPRPNRELAPLLADELMRRERHRDEGGALLNNQQVCVCASRPLELDPAHAATVRRNLRRRIRYHYFFRANDTAGADDAEMVARLLSELVAADAGTDAPPSQVAASVRALSQGLRIHLLPHEPPLEFCIHNALHLGVAACFVQRRPEEFYCWYSGTRAHKVAQDLLEQMSPHARTAGHIVHGTRSYSSRGRQGRATRARIVDEIERRFDGKLERHQVERYCFGPIPAPGTAWALSSLRDVASH